ncbi:MAG: 5,6-dimethylbenzimidazole synthase [Thermus sp.]|uniref:5,6-dimethylbenzimidazole synthase n=1 Tax=Thermus sp. TaxID=275 RepID=UPI00351B1417
MGSYWAFSQGEREAVYRAILARRDIRHFRPDPIPEEVLKRLYQAFHAAPSVGLTKPWAVVEIRERGTKEEVFALHQRARSQERALFQGKAQRVYDRLRLEGLLEAPLHLAVFQRPVPRSLGHQTMPETLTYSVVLAVGNLWIAARAEGIGVGWVSILDPEAVERLLGAPPGYRLVAYLCLGYPRAWPEEPLLKRAGWRHEEPLLRYRERFP